MNKKMGLIGLFFLPLFISSCGNDEYVEAGFSERNNHVFFKRINVAVRAKKKQNINEVHFDVYPGAIKGFERYWEDYPDNPHSGDFYMSLKIKESEKANELLFKLDDFPNEDKYLVTYNNASGKDSNIPKYTEYIEYKIDFSQYSRKSNIFLSWRIIYCDDSGTDIHAEVFNGLGGSPSEELYINCDTDTAFLRSK